jgi:hypothetical protein
MPVLQQLHIQCHVSVPLSANVQHIYFHPKPKKYTIRIVTRSSPEPVIAHLAQIGRVVLENSIIYQRMGG